MRVTLPTMQNLVSEKKTKNNREKRTVFCDCGLASLCRLTAHSHTAISHTENSRRTSFTAHCHSCLSATDTTSYATYQFEKWPLSFFQATKLSATFTNRTG